MKSERALVVLPCYDERPNIERLVGALLALDAGIELLIIDDNSPDGTGEAADALARRHPEVHVMHRPGKLGLGTAYRAGFRYALEGGYGWVVTMDADLSHQPRYLPDLLRLGREAELVVGSRYTEGGGAEGWPLRRRVISGTANFMAQTILGVTARDCTSGYRCYSTAALEAVDPDTVLSSGYSFLVEMLYRVERAGLQVRETPIIFLDRVAGKSKINRTEVYKTLYTLGRLRLPWLPWPALGAVAARFTERTAAAALVGLGAGAWLLWRRR